VLAVMFGWMILLFSLSVATASRDPNVEVPTEVNLGVMVTPADGWYSAADVWDVGPTGISLQSSGAYAAFWADEYAGSNDDLLAEMVASLDSQFESFRTLPAASIETSGIAGLLTVFSGVADYGRVEGELAVFTRSGVGVVMWAEAQEGQLARIQDDLEFMLDSLVIPG
jgi:hypothetical protein